MLARFAMSGINGINTMIAVTLELGQIVPRISRRVVCRLFWKQRQEATLLERGLPKWLKLLLRIEDCRSEEYLARCSIDDDNDAIAICH